MKIRKEHEQALVNAARESFILKSLVFLEENQPEWCSEKNDIEKRQFVEEMLAFSHDCHIVTAGNVQKLIFYKIEYGFEIPLSAYRKHKLSRNAFDEGYRISQFLDSLLSGNDFTLVSLGDDGGFRE